MNRTYRKNTSLGYLTPVLLSATASTDFDLIEGCIQTTARNEINSILFLVASDMNSAPRVIPLSLYMNGASSLKIEPFIIHIDSDENISIGTGANRSQLDGSSQYGQLERLSAHLETYSAAARSAAVDRAPCLLLVAPKASYQRFIDILSLINKYDLKPFLRDSSEEPNQKPPSTPKKKPLPPYPKETTPR